MNRFLTLLVLSATCITGLRAADSFVSFSRQPGVALAPVGSVHVDEEEYPGVKRAVANLISDMQASCGRQLQVTVGSIDRSTTVQRLMRNKVIDRKSLQGKTEKYIIRVADDQIIIAGSDKRGTIYGIYELSRQLGVSPWAWWADMPVTRHDSVFLNPGLYTDGEPVVRYRGIFLNDEAPCLSGWVREKFPDSACPTADPKLARGFNHHFYERVFELLQRLRANYMWPAMWSNAFYADDSENSRLADEMGIIMGTSHHEPMARNHQEWARHRRENGAWDYVTNQEVIDQFFREGVRRSKDNEDIITIGMRGDGDTAMGGKEGHDEDFVPNDEFYIKLYEKIFRNQRQIIKEETGRAANKRVQLWALYKEVQRYYDLGLTVPEDVIIMLCDDNWGNIRRVPAALDANGQTVRKPHAGGYGMYYHVDYVGAPRNTKWANVTPAAHMWEQMQLCCQYGIDKLWILNVGDLKPMEYPIQLFLDMAWNPAEFDDPRSVQAHTEAFCNGIFGYDADMLAQGYGREAARLLTAYTTYNGRVTPEMLNARTYNLATGEWAQVVRDYRLLEADALRLYQSLPQDALTATGSAASFAQLLLYPIQSMANLYEMYYAQARGCQAEVDRCFARDAELTRFYHSINGGKWNHLMDQTHIGYRSWNEPRQNVCPQALDRPSAPSAPAVYGGDAGYVSIEAEHYAQATATQGKWLTIPNYGRTLSGVAHWPYTAPLDGAALTYRFDLPAGTDSVRVHVVTNSTLPFLRKEGHRYAVSIDGGAEVVVNYNGDLTEENQWHTFDVVATRIIERIVPMSVTGQQRTHTLTVRPIDPGMVLEKLVIDYGGYQAQHLFGTERSIK